MRLLFLSVAATVLIQRLFELHTAKKNVTEMLAEGGREYGARHYPAVIALHLIWYPAWIAEGLHNGLHLNSYWPYWAALLLFSEILRYWVMKSLGSQWSMRIIIKPNTRWIRHGPYRYFAHPNYLAVTIELFAIPMLFNAWRTALVATAIYIILLLAFRIPAERKAIEDLGASFCNPS